MRWILVFIMLTVFPHISLSQTKSPEADFFGEVQNDESMDNDTAYVNNSQFNGFFRYQLGVNLERKAGVYVPNRRAPKLTKSKISFSANVQDEVGAFINYKMGLVGYYDASYQLNDSSSYTVEQKSAFESSVEMAESYLNLTLSNALSLSVGRLIIAWGQSETSPVIDIINPRDIREFGQTMLEDMRLPVGAMKLNYTRQHWSAEFVSVFEFRGNRVGVRGSDFDPYLALRDKIIQDEIIPYPLIKGYELYFRLKTYLEKGEIAMMLGSGYDKSSVLNQADNHRLVPEYKRTQTIGISGNRVWQAWLTKFELAYKHNKAMQKIQGWSRKAVVQSMVGVDYTGFSDTSITFEWNSRYIRFYTADLLDNKIQHTYSLFLRRTYLNNRFASEIAWFRYGENNGDIFRMNMSYEYRDDIHLALNYFIYYAPEPEAMLYNYRNNDRIVSTVSYYY